MSPLMNVKPPGPARTLRSHANPSPSIHGGVDPSSTMAPPARFPRDGATTCPLDHCKKPQTSMTGEPPFHTVTGRNAMPVRLATVAPTVDPHSQNAFEDLAQTDDESCAAADGIYSRQTTKSVPPAGRTAIPSLCLMGSCSLMTPQPTILILRTSSFSTMMAPWLNPP
jgi:hypothetical protein